MHDGAYSLLRIALHDAPYPLLRILVWVIWLRTAPSVIFLGTHWFILHGDVLAAQGTLHEGVYSLLRIALHDALYLLLRMIPILGDLLVAQHAFGHLLGNTLIHTAWGCVGCSGHIA